MNLALCFQCAQAGGEHSELHGATRLAEAHRLLAQVSAWWRQTWCVVKSCQVSCTNKSIVSLMCDHFLAVAGRVKRKNMRKGKGGGDEEEEED